MFTTTVAAAKDAGKPVVLVGLVGDRPYGTVLQAARSLKSSSVVVGVSEQGAERQTEETSSDGQQIAAPGGVVHVEIRWMVKGLPPHIDLEFGAEAPG